MAQLTYNRFGVDRCLITFPIFRANMGLNNLEVAEIRWAVALLSSSLSHRIESKRLDLKPSILYFKKDSRKGADDFF